MNRPFRALTILACILSFFALASCEKEEDAVKGIMEGSIDFPFPQYIQKNTLVNITISGITNPAVVEYKWFAASMVSDTAVTNVICHRVPDSVGIFGITAIAQADGYYSTTASVLFQTIDTTGNTTVTGLKNSSTSYTDPRDGKTYPTVKLGSLEWFARNLGWDGTGGPYCDSPVLDGYFGRFYTWTEATGGTSATGLLGGPQGACPPGWKVPTKEDWEDLCTAVLGSAKPFTDTWDGLGDKLSTPACFLGERMWPYSPDNGHSNTTGWNALPVGGVMRNHTNFTDFGLYGYFWTATEKDADRAYYRYIYADQSGVPMSSTSKTDFGASLRCVRSI